jgi:hypothetical protein
MGLAQHPEFSNQALSSECVLKNLQAIYGSHDMNKKEINSPLLTADFLLWVCGVGGMLLIAVLGHYVWKVF